MPAYSEFIDRLLLPSDLLRKLHPAEPYDRDAVRRLQAADAATLGSPSGLVRGGVYYALDALDPAHELFQQEPTPLGSYWHGMLHRREGDYDNARYWFRRAGALPFFAKLHRSVSEFSPLMGRQTHWDPYLFTNQCEHTRRGEEDTEKLPELQRAEFNSVFDYTWRQEGK